MPIRIQRKRTKGFNMQAQSPDGAPVMSVCRPGKWGNPFKITVDGQGNKWVSLPGDAVTAFRQWVPERLAMKPDWLAPLRGKHLACFCPLVDECGNYVPCHADVLLELANA